MWHQIPSQFEFNADFILFLAESLQKGKYGTFCCNSEQERKAAGLSRNSVSIWMEVDLRKDFDFRNPYFFKSEKGVKLTQIPETNCYRLRIWSEYFFRYTTFP